MSLSNRRRFVLPSVSIAALVLATAILGVSVGRSGLEYAIGSLIVMIVIALPLGLASLLACDLRAGAVSALVLLLLLFDPYTSGRTGGHTGFYPLYPWQRWATALLIGLLAVGAFSLCKGRIRVFAIAFVAEVTLFILLNAIYLQRDGFAKRAYVNLEDSPMPLFAAVAGATIRLLLLLSFRRVLRSDQ